jgi:hypothetical protein
MTNDTGVLLRFSDADGGLSETLGGFKSITVVDNLMVVDHLCDGGRPEIIAMRAGRQWIPTFPIYPEDVIWEEFKVFTR